MLHSLLPHVPYLYLPSGQRYGVQAPLLRGIQHNRWQQAWPALQADQRYLLQVEYTDRALGLITQRLKAKGIYDRALVIVVADHGVSNRPGQPRRRPTPGNLQDIAFVPLFVKLPNQHTGRINDGLARTIDIVPTIAHVLGVKMPWHVDGKTLIGRHVPSNGTVRIELGGGQAVSAPLSVLRARRAQALAQQLERFGGTPSSVYRIGPDRDLVGRRLSELPVTPSQSAGVELQGQQLLNVVDTHTDLLPTWVEGRLTGKHPSSANVAIAVNGRVAAVTKTFEGGGATSFAAMVPASALRNGHNDVTVLLVGHDEGERTLEQLRGSSTTTTLVRRGGREVLVSSDGTTVPVRPGSLRGMVQLFPGSLLGFSGWAAEPALTHRADSIAVFADGKEVFASPTDQLLPHRIFPHKGLFGFHFELPKGLLPSPGPKHHVRVFAIRNDGHGAAHEGRVGVGEATDASGRRLRTGGPVRERSNSLSVITDYFDAATVNRQRLLWTVATRRQLERWQPIVARVVRGGFEGRSLTGADVWSAAIEHHFALVAARNLFQALDLHPPMCVSVNPTLRSEVIEGRDLHEHGRENVPVYQRDAASRATTPSDGQGVRARGTHWKTSATASRHAHRGQNDLDRHRALNTKASHAPGRNRTCDLALRRRALYPLSYRRSGAKSSGGVIGVTVDGLWPRRAPHTFGQPPLEGQAAEGGERRRRRPRSARPRTGASRAARLRRAGRGCRRRSTTSR